MSGLLLVAVRVSTDNPNDVAAQVKLFCEAVPSSDTVPPHWTVLPAQTIQSSHRHALGYLFNTNEGM
jgi:hypothetical protein